MAKVENKIAQKEQHVRDLKKKYDREKREQKPISFNKNKESDLLMIADKMNLSVWVKTLLSSFTQAEISLINKESTNMIPAVLIEQAIENKFFLIEEYLAAQGKKIVDIEDKPKRGNQMIHINEEFDEFNQEYHG